MSLERLVLDAGIDADQHAVEIMMNRAGMQHFLPGSRQIAIDAVFLQAGDVQGRWIDVFPDMRMHQRRNQLQNRQENNSKST